MRDEQNHHDMTPAEPQDQIEAETVPRIEHRVDIERNGTARLSGQRYRATYEGEVIVVSSKDCEFDACRVLLARGITGKLATYFRGGTLPRMRFDIETGATLTCVENPTVRPVFRTWTPYPAEMIHGDAEE